MLKKDTFLFRYLTKQADRRIKDIQNRITEENRKTLELEIVQIEKELEESLKVVETLEENDELIEAKEIATGTLINEFDQIVYENRSDFTFSSYERRVRKSIEIYCKFYKITNFCAHFEENNVPIQSIEDETTEQSFYTSRSADQKLPKYVLEYLLPFQRKSLYFFQSNYLNQSGSILADEMGLGKTVQVIAYLISQCIQNDNNLSALIICPVILLNHWMNEIRKIFPFFRVIILHSKYREDENFESNYENDFSDEENTDEISSFLSESFKQIIFITSYETFKKESDRIIRKMKIASRNQRAICVLDEAHKIKNPNSQVHQSVEDLKSSLDSLFLLTTGTPIQNNLVELYSLMKFCNDILGGMEDYLNGIVRPIEDEIREIGLEKQRNRRKIEKNKKFARNKYQPADLIINERKSTRISYLKSLISPFILRRTKKTHFQISKNEFVITCPLSESQVVEYERICEYVLRQNNPGILRGVNLLRRVLNHLKSARSSQISTTFELPAENDDTLHLSESFAKMISISELSWHELVEQSGKLSVINYLLRTWLTKKSVKSATDQNDAKILIFSQSLGMLSILEEYMRRIGVGFLRMDGNTPIEKRDEFVKIFNSNGQDFKNFISHDFYSSNHSARWPDTPQSYNLREECRVFLLSTRATSLGINLSAANKIIIVDPDWNPSVDKQAIDRACRIGQRRTVTVIRLVCGGTVEECVLGKQVYKEILCAEILKNQEKESLSDEEELEKTNKKPKRRQLSPMKNKSLDFLTPSLTDMFSLGDFKLIKDFDFATVLKEVTAEQILGENEIVETIEEGEKSLFELDDHSRNKILSAKEMIDFINDREEKYGNDS